MTQKIASSVGTATLECFPLENTTAPAVVICPGGGYEFCSPREAEPVARAYNREGFHAFVLWYDCDYAPLPAPLGYAPVQQLGWAVQYVREHSAEYGIIADQIAVCGFSAGGHLACSLGTFWHRTDLFADRKSGG